MVPARRRQLLPTPPQSRKQLFGAARPVATKDQKEASQVPKMKSHTGMGKRVKVTGGGKVLREQAGKRHLLEGKSSKVTRRMTGTVEVAKADRKRVKKLLGR
jgi:large subunit ribosomal protein L35